VKQSINEKRIYIAPDIASESEAQLGGGSPTESNLGKPWRRVRFPALSSSHAVDRHFEAGGGERGTTNTDERSG